VLQRGAARRLCEGDSRGLGRLDRHWELRLGLPLPRRAFMPPPRVDSVVLVVTRR
jgi:23S rRNA (adenine-N6)-dimethyltransferase